MFIQLNVFDYSKCILTGTLRNIVDCTDTANEELLVSDDVSKRFKPTVQVALVDERHRFVASSQLASSEERYSW